jgi:diguanylate cyclase (GGDEF)-like protein
MNTILILYAFFLFCLILLTAKIAYQAFFNSDGQGSHTLGLLVLAMTDWAFFYLLELFLPTLPLKILSRKIVYFGIAMSAPLWFAFVLRYTGRLNWWIKKRWVFWLFVPGFIICFLGLTNELHHLIWTKTKMPLSGLGGLSLEYGPAFWAGAAYNYALIMLGMAIYAANYLRAPDVVRKQMGFVLLGSLVTFLVNVAYVFGYLPKEIDPTPLGFLVTSSLFAIGFFRLGLLDLIPLAAPSIVDNLLDAVIVVDRNDRITNLNKAAFQWLRVDPRVLGRNIFDLLPGNGLFKTHWEEESASFMLEIESPADPHWYDVHVTQLFDNDRTLLGRVIVVRNITEEIKLIQAATRRSEQLGLLEEVGRRVADTLDEHEILQRTVDAVIERFGYAEAAISLLVENKFMEVTAISGTEDFGYKPGFRQDLGSGIIGHVGKTKQTYISDRVENDPYYFSTADRTGSALGVPILNHGMLLGVLYVENSLGVLFGEDDVRTLETLANHVAASLQRARLFTKTQAHLRVMSTVQSISHIISSSLDLENIFQTVVRVLKESFGYTYVSIYLLEEDYLNLGAQYGYPEEMILYHVHVSQGVMGRTVLTRKTQFVGNVSDDPSFLRADNNVSSEICVPMMKDDIVLGVINVEADASAPLSQADVELLNTLAGPIALAVDNARLHAQVKTVAMTDAVTGLYNRHAFEEMLQAEIYRASKYSGVFSLIIFDIDYFKQYNDTWGHPAGDIRLRAIADLIRNALRKNDVPARYGGDEFAIILPDTNSEGVMKFVKRLLGLAQNAAPQDVRFIENGIPGYTLSIGVATFPKNGDTLASILLAADQAELQAKRTGKNQVVFADDLNKT